MADSDGRRARIEKITQDVVQREIFYTQADIARDLLQKIMDATHYYVDKGGVVLDTEGRPVESPWPKVRAASEMRQWLDLEAQVRGWYKPAAKDGSHDTPGQG